MLTLVSTVVIKTIIKRNSGRKGLIATYSCGKKKSGKELKAVTETELRKNRAYWFGSSNLLSLFSCTSQDHLSKDGIVYYGLHLST